MRAADGEAIRPACCGPGRLNPRKKVLIHPGLVPLDPDSYTEIPEGTCEIVNCVTGAEQ